MGDPSEQLEALVREYVLERPAKIAGSEELQRMAALRYVVWRRCACAFALRETFGAPSQNALSTDAYPACTCTDSPCVPPAPLVSCGILSTVCRWCGALRSCSCRR
jgi:hypothetical protein